MVFDAFCSNPVVNATGRKENLVVPVVPRSSSPVTVYVELPCIVEKAFSTIAWDDFEDSASGETHDISPLGYRAKDCDSEDHALDYVQEFTADSPLESSLSPADLVPFQGCVIPPLTPQPDFSEDSGLIRDEGNIPIQNKANWEKRPQYHGCVLGFSADNNHTVLENKQGETEGYKERNRHLKQLASRAKHLAAVLEKLTTVSEPNIREAVIPHEDHATLSPCKRQRLDEGYETETDSVEDMLRDISTRCNAVLHRAVDAEADSIRTFGSFSGLQTSFSNTSSEKMDTAEEAERGSLFRASVREHSTIKTQAFPHGHAFTTRTQRGGYCFRWIPTQS
ncbi:multicilin [Boleophthalmus pectinirostris]|uniref:multicilin n=1 Tax=Boleophthalmus pectinirostris TaxID=150288 RepID=UPI0024313002|nr:multicilin [Boleophthalmus pectinirostris]